MRDPTGHELSALLDPPLEGPGGNAGLAHDITIPYQGSASIRNGNIVAQITSGIISFHRVEANGSTTLLMGEYVDAKALPARYYVQDFRASSFQAEYSFRVGEAFGDDGEMIFGAGQQACCLDHSVNKKGKVVDLINFNSQVALPVWMSSKVGTRLLVNPRNVTWFLGLLTILQYAQPRSNRWVEPLAT